MNSKKYILIIFLFLIVFIVFGYSGHTKSNILTSEIENLSKKIESYETKIVDSSDTIERLEEDSNEKDKAITIIEEEKQDLIASIDYYVEQIKYLENSNSDLEKKIIILEKEIKDNSTLRNQSKLSKEEAVDLVLFYIDENSIKIDYPEYEVQYWEAAMQNNQNYIVIRGCYLDPFNKNSTKTIFRYWINENTFKILRENLYTGELYDELTN